ncbi:hypothetical protein VN97_g10323 [Penicillium thymicola]|uniref:Uncharacterized protein n=1 Tax=Penicillium thymicola TaxID=293382 RepID=A0AAI9X4F4_PENTH|nr:hypothetical protein VN97_g10323 [Penicillium thymicola]
MVVGSSALMMQHMMKRKGKGKEKRNSLHHETSRKDLSTRTPSLAGGQNMGQHIRCRRSLVHDMQRSPIVLLLLC